MTASSATSGAPAPIARVALVRDRGAMLGGPLLVIVTGLILAAVSLLTLPSPLNLAGAAFGGLVALGGALVGIRTWSLKLLVEPDYLHLTGLATDRRYHLVPGQLSRLPTAGPRRAHLRVRIGSLGWAVGRARLAGGEQIEVIRLGASPAVILVPTERGRVALAVRSESDLVAALTAAAQRRAERPAMAVVPTTPATVAPPPVPAPVPAPVPGRPLTGIERMALEERLAQERRAALFGARSEQAAASFSASVAALPAASAVTPTARPTATVPPRPIAQPVRRRPAAPMARRVSRPALNTTALLLGAPLLGALLVWGLAFVTGATSAGDGLDPVTAAVLLIGPATALAVLLSRDRWPRLAGLTAASAMLALLLVARGIMG